MRPVNLIPPDERRGDSAPLRTGTLIYVLLGGLALLLLGIVAVALTSKQISDRQSEKSSLQQELTSATSQAQSVQAFTSFRTVQEQRQATVASLAQSRFDWSRVLHELALVLPSDIQLTALTGTVTPDVQIDSGAGSSSSGSGTSLRSDVKGPALQIDGCAPTQDSVASFVAALEDIDGVTRVGLDSSKIPDNGGSSATPTGEPGDQAISSSNGCPQSKPYTFTIVAAFDAVPAPATASAAPSVPAAPATATASAQTTSNDQVSDGLAEENVQKAAANKQISKAQNARATVLGGG